MRYRCIAPTQQLIPALHRLVQPGEVFESDIPLHNASFERVIEQPARPAEEV